MGCGTRSVRQKNCLRCTQPKPWPTSRQREKSTNPTTSVTHPLHNEKGPTPLFSEVGRFFNYMNTAESFTETTSVAGTGFEAAISGTLEEEFVCSEMRADPYGSLLISWGIGWLAF